MAPALGPGRVGPKRRQWSAGVRNLGEVDTISIRPIEWVSFSLDHLNRKG